MAAIPATLLGRLCRTLSGQADQLVKTGGQQPGVAIKSAFARHVVASLAKEARADFAGVPGEPEAVVTSGGWWLKSSSRLSYLHASSRCAQNVTDLVASVLRANPCRTVGVALA
jgi:hypothetical protein